MPANFLSKNLALLKSHHPKAYEVINNSIPTSKFFISESNSGLPTLSYINDEGNQICLLSKYDPLKEANSLINSLNPQEHTNYIVSSMGLCYQIIELIKLAPTSSRIIVIERNPELARLAFETKDLSQVILFPGLSFAFPETTNDVLTILEKDKFNYCLNGYQLVRQKSLHQIDAEGNNEFLGELEKFFQAATIELKTQTAKSKLFYNNVRRNFSNLISSNGIEAIKNSFQDMPAIICSAGPSLDKNIQYLKPKRDNFILISAATALEPLFKNGISPDFVVAIDPDELTPRFFDFQSKIENTWLIYDPVVPSIIPEFFKDKRFTYDSPVNLAQWLKKHIGSYGSLGKVFSVAHAAFELANNIGCSPIIFIGQDLSFSGNRLHSRNSYYYQEKEKLLGPIETMENLDEKKFRKYSENLFDGPNIFGGQLKTTVALDTYAQMLSDSFSNNSNIFNATEGGMGIRGTENILLREAINTYCCKNISTLKTNILKSLPPIPPKIAEVHKTAEKKLTCFREISNQLAELETGLKQGQFITDITKESFVRKMRSIIQDLLEDEEATLLLQGYDYSGFAIWNQKSNEISKNKMGVGNPDRLEEEFQRDKNFLDSLKNSVKFHLDFFSSLANKDN